MEQCKATDSVRSRPGQALASMDRDGHSDTPDQALASMDTDGQSDGLELVVGKKGGASVKQAPKGRLHTSSDNFGELKKISLEERRILRVWNEFILQMIRRK